MEKGRNANAHRACSCACPSEGSSSKLAYTRLTPDDALEGDEARWRRRARRRASRPRWSRRPCSPFDLVHLDARSMRPRSCAATRAVVSGVVSTTRLDMTIVFSFGDPPGRCRAGWGGACGRRCAKRPAPGACQQGAAGRRALLTSGGRPPPRRPTAEGAAVLALHVAGVALVVRGIELPSCLGRAVGIVVLGHAPWNRSASGSSCSLAPWQP